MDQVSFYMQIALAIMAMSRSLNPFMNQVSFYTINELIRAFLESLNPFMNQVSFYAYETLTNNISGRES